MVQIRMHGQGPKKTLIPKYPFLESSPSKYKNPYSPELLWFQEELKGFLFPGLSNLPGLVHRVFTRWGGVSEPPYDNLNVSYSVSDRPAHIKTNLEKIKDVLRAERLMFMTQEHGENIVILRKDTSPSHRGIPSADAMITNMPHLALMVKQADCQGVIIFDPGKKVLAIVHCGWRGHVRNILQGVVTRMKKDFACRPSDLFAAVGPSLGPCCAEFTTYKDIFPGHFETFLVQENHFDLWAVSRRQLQKAGLKRKNIEIAGICNRCRTDLFYSYRGEGKTGRFATVAMLQ